MDLSSTMHISLIFCAFTTMVFLYFYLRKMEKEDTEFYDKVDVRLENMNLIKKDVDEMIDDNERMSNEISFLKKEIIVMRTIIQDHIKKE